MISIATWNVNSIKARHDHVIDWLKETNTDIVLLQELKVVDEVFPYDAIEALGYNCTVHGQKTYNGVAILSKHPIDDITRGIPDFTDDQARYIEASISLNNAAIRVASIYVPNGQAPDSEKFAYKMAFLDALSHHTNQLLNYDEPIVLGGDYNIAPTALDVYDPNSLKGSICFHPEEHKKLSAITHQGWLDSYRLLHPNDKAFTWWDYRAGAWQQDKGLRIDYLLCNPQSADQLTSCTIDRTPRGKEKASDHTPVVAQFTL